MAQRIAYLDIVGGLCILHICISHIVQDLGLEANMGGVLHVVFWSMAWFFFLTGLALPAVSMRKMPAFHDIPLKTGHIRQFYFAP